MRNTCIDYTAKIMQKPIRHMDEYSLENTYFWDQKIYRFSSITWAILIFTPLCFSYMLSTCQNIFFNTCYEASQLCLLKTIHFSLLSNIKTDVKQSHTRQALIDSLFRWCKQWEPKLSYKLQRKSSVLFCSQKSHPLNHNDISCFKLCPFSCVTLVTVFLVVLFREVVWMAEELRK